MLLQQFNVRLKFVATMTFLTAAASACRPAVPERAKLWSERAANDFNRLIKTGRKVGTAATAVARSANQGPSQSTSIGGLNAFNLELSQDGKSLLFAQFDPRTTPAVKAAQLQQFATDLSQRMADQLGVNPAELKAIPQESAHPSQKILAFTREIAGVPVRDSALQFIFSQQNDSFHLIEIKNRTYGHLPPQPKPDGRKLDAERIGQVLKNINIKIDASGDSYILETRGGIERLHPATWYTISGVDDQTYTLTFTGGNEPRLLEAYSHRADGVVEARVFERYWGGGVRSLPIPDLTVETSNGNLTLDGNGQSPGGPVTGRVSMRSRWFRGTTETAGNPAFEVRTDGQKSSIVTADGQPSSMINVYSALARVRAYASQFYRPGETSYFNRQLVITTDIQKTCNAFYQAATLNFFSRGNNCANMAFVNDVIYHEWGHGLDDFTGPGSSLQSGMTDAAFSEGIGDIVAMFMNGDEYMGIGFYTSAPQRPIRKLDNQKVYVPGEESEIHEQGTIIGGAFWELRRRMINKYGAAGHDKAARLFYRHLLEAASYKDSYRIIQRMADDDQNPATRHPDWCVINHSFAQKGLTQLDGCGDHYNDASNSAEMRVFAAVGEPLQGAAPLFAAVALDSASSVKVCAGRDLCAQPVTLSLIKTESGIKFFGNASWTPSNDQIISIHVFDSGGQVIARRVVRFTRR